LLRLQLGLLPLLRFQLRLLLRLGSLLRR